MAVGVGVRCGGSGQRIRRRHLLDRVRASFYGRRVLTLCAQLARPGAQHLEFGSRRVSANVCPVWQHESESADGGVEVQSLELRGVSTVVSML